MAVPALPRWKPNKDEQADLDAMNLAVVRIRRHTPGDPYYLEIPQENSARFSHHHSQRHQWTRDTPFARQEKESLQYQTFHLYEQGKEMFEQHSTRLEAAVSTRPGIVRSGTPSTAPKNKISLAAYKKKQNAATTTPELNAQKVGDAPAKQAAVKGPVERAKAETEEMLATIAEEVPMATKKEVQVPVKDLKRKRDEREQQDRVGDSKVETPAENVEPATKKAKAIPDKPVERSSAQHTQQQKPSAAAITKDDAVSGTSKPDEQRLPPRLSPQLSPLLPDRLSPLPETHSSAMSLPPRLTPTIPLNITKTLEAQKDVPTASQSSIPTATKTTSKDKEAMLSPLKKGAEKVTKHKSPVPPRNGFRANSSSPAVRSEAEERIRPANSVPKAALPSQDDEVVVAKTKKGKSAEGLSDSPILQKPRLLLKLKYRKSQASAIKRILGMRAAPKKNMLAPAPASPGPPSEELKSAPVEKRNGEPKDGLGHVKGVAQKVGPVKKDKKSEKLPAAEKRPPAEKPSIEILEPQASAETLPVVETQQAAQKRQLHEEEKDESPAKRKKIEAPTARKEPSTPAKQMTESPSTKSQTHATPSARNNLLAVAMARDKSQDSNSTQTPPGTVNTPTIGSTSQPNGAARPASGQPSSKTPRQQAWGAEARQYEKLGKELKHAAHAHQHNKMPNSPALPIDQKLAAVKSIESFLCFMVGFCCLDEAGLAAEPRPHPPEIRNWQSLQGFQGFVKRNTEHFPALAGLAASLSVVFAARVLEIATQYHREDGITRKEIFDMQGLLTKSANEADAKLDVDILQTSFPKSWSQRSKNLPSREKLDLAKLGGQYRLPIALATSPIRAARAGCAILREWLDCERINYSLKLKLG